ncbi:MAG TPA: glycerophosphoryl diester phosphodiesterase membrane domain-containing protein [Chitinophagaceae bacterium]
MRSIEELRETRNTFEIGRAISDGWKLVSKYLGYYIGAGVITVIISMGVGFIPIVGALVNNLLLSPCFAASAIFITWRISRGEGWTDFGDMFKGFAYAMPVLISTLIQSFVMILIAVLCFYSLIPELVELWGLSQGSGAYQNQEEIAALFQSIFFNTKNILLFSLFMLAMLFISAVWAFRLHFIVVYKMDAWPAMELSRKVTAPNLLRLVGLFILISLIVIVSALPCGIGLLFSLPWSFGAVYSAFAQITGSDQPDENNYMFDFMSPGNNTNQ